MQSRSHADHFPQAVSAKTYLQSSTIILKLLSETSVNQILPIGKFILSLLNRFKDCSLFMIKPVHPLFVMHCKRFCNVFATFLQRILNKELLERLCDLVAPLVLIHAKNYIVCLHVHCLFVCTLFVCMYIVSLYVYC